LPDLKHENDYVKNTLLSWIQNLVSKYNIDGIRIDTIPEVPKWFWKLFSTSAGVFSIGEIFDGRTNYVSDYQNYIDATLNYPLYFSIKSVFGQEHSMFEFESKFQDINKNFKDPAALGVFVDNHDNARFLNSQQNQERFKSALVFSLMASKTFFKK
jgi:alpha-amylase